MPGKPSTGPYADKMDMVARQARQTPGPDVYSPNRVGARALQVLGEGG